jgi:hypothetical protein
MIYDVTVLLRFDLFANIAGILWLQFLRVRASGEEERLTWGDTGGRNWAGMVAVVATHVGVDVELAATIWVRALKSCKIFNYKIE